MSPLVSLALLSLSLGYASGQVFRFGKCPDLPVQADFDVDRVSTINYLINEWITKQINILFSLILNKMKSIHFCWMLDKMISFLDFRFQENNSLGF